jgi:hypothetical protein
MTDLRIYRKVHELITDADHQDWEGAAALLLPESMWDGITPETAMGLVLTEAYRLLSVGHMEEFASICWSEHVFSLKARSARRTWELYEESTQLLIMGAGAVGKSFTIGARALLDWARDPENCLVHVVSVTRGHAKKNLFGQIQTLHKMSAIPFPGIVSNEKISVDTNNDTSGIHLVGIPPGESGKGRLRGMHPKPRLIPHPLFGNLTLVRILLDEAEEIPVGIWQDLRNAFITIEGGNSHTLKVAGSSNPTDVQSEYGQRCVPDGGFENHPDDCYEWVSSRGWCVYRIDAAATENVMQRKMVCEGMQTYEGYQAAMKDAGGEGTSGYFIMCRGMFPPQGHEGSIIPPNLVRQSRGEWIFEETAREIFSVDTALEGGDNCELTAGRVGMAYRARVLNDDGKWEVVTIHDEARQVIQADYQITVPKGDSVWIANQVDKELPGSITGDNICMDGTGVGAGAHSIMCDKRGDVLGISYGTSASEVSVMSDDERTAKETYVNTAAELWYSARRWMESKLLMISPKISIEVDKELSGRRGSPSGYRYRVERKDKYKNRNKGKSPDKAESLIQLVHLVRMRGELFAGQLRDFDAGVTEDMEITSESDEFSKLDMYDVMKD